ncbi:hypothetical protein H733_0717 [Haemophilus influenzae CGSHiCZ412602]|nr:hypothetical protein H733_0717 [Haemophilus influenzae CGSHiCZ412602]
MYIQGKPKGLNRAHFLVKAQAYIYNQLLCLLHRQNSS